MSSLIFIMIQEGLLYEEVDSTLETWMDLADPQDISGDPVYVSSA